MLFFVITWAQHFMPEWEQYVENPFLSHTIFVTSAILNGVVLGVGDEIGVFDGDICVGAGVVGGAFDPDETSSWLEIVTSAQDAIDLDNIIPGFINGNDIFYRFWDASEQSEVWYVFSEYLSGYNSFTFQSVSYVSLSGEGSCMDFDLDGVCDTDDLDDDNDGVIDMDDSDDNDPFSCSDVDMDTCDDCSSGIFDPLNDGPDMDYDGICDAGDPDDDTDGDGVIDDEDSDPFNPYQCADNDGDACDDCGSGYYDPSNDGDDYDGDGICNAGDMDDDNDGVVDSEDCAPLYELASEVDCCGVCGGDNSSCGNCCGMPFGDDCSSVCEIDEMGVCCMIDEMDECGICFGDNSFCSNCELPFIDVDGHCLHQGDIDALQDLIDNSMNSGYDFGCQDLTDPYCASPNLTMDQGDNWHWVIIDGDSHEFSNDSGIVDPLELGLQEWNNGRLTSLMCGAYIYCQLSGELPSSLSNLTDIEVLRLEVNYFTGYVPGSICELENVDFDDYLSFDLSYNELCPPYPGCISENSVQFMQTSNCINGDFNQDGFVNIIDIVQIIDAILNNIEIQGADVNEDGFINVIDVVTLVSYILNN